MPEHELPPADQEQKAPPADQESAPDSKLWPKEIRDAYLRMANRFDQAKKELESRISEMQRQLEERDKLIAQLAQQYGQGTQEQTPAYPYQLPQTHTGQSLPYTGQAGTATGTPTDELDPLDPNSVKSFVNRTVQEALTRLGQSYYQDQLARMQYTNMAIERALDWGAQMAYLYRLDPDITPQDVRKIVEHAARHGQVDLVSAYRDVFRDRIAQREQEKMREEIRRKLEEELASQKTAYAVMGPPTGPVPLRRAPDRVPTSLQEATRQALEEYGGKIITPE